MAIGRADHRCCLTTEVWERTCVIARDMENYVVDTKLYQQRMLMDPHRPTCDGLSVLEMIEAELDAIMERLMAPEGAQAEDGRDPGRAEGLAVAIAIIRNPYRPDLDLVRAMAVERWEAKVAELEPCQSGHVLDADGACISGCGQKLQEMEPCCAAKEASPDKPCPEHWQRTTRLEPEVALSADGA